jgi:hypothetical protein
MESKATIDHTNYNVNSNQTTKDDEKKNTKRLKNKTNKQTQSKMTQK